MPKYVIMTLFFIFAGTPSPVVPSGHLGSLNLAVGQRFPGSEVSHNSWIVEGYLWLGLIVVEHSSLALATELTGQ